MTGLDPAIHAGATQMPPRCVPPAVPFPAHPAGGGCPAWIRGSYPELIRVPGMTVPPYSASGSNAVSFTKARVISVTTAAAIT